MKNKDCYHRILILTADEGWLSHPEIVHVVQELGKEISDASTSRLSFKGSKGVAVMGPDNNIRKYASIKDCAAKEKLCRTTITKHVKNKKPMKDGRIFTIF